MAGRGGGFLARVMQYVVNEIIVDRLANNQSFQRFAVRSSKAIEDMAQKGAQTRDELAQQMKSFSDTFKSEISRSFKDTDKRFLTWQCDEWSIAQHRQSMCPTQSVGGLHDSALNPFCLMLDSESWSQITGNVRFCIGVQPLLNRQPLERFLVADTAGTCHPPSVWLEGYVHEEFETIRW